jgi:dephospho-CoA kinase
MGKTTTAGMFLDAGVPVHDSDKAVHELYESAAVAPIAAVFPEAVEQGKINRTALGKRVLGDALALRRLEEIVHPLVSGSRRSFLDRLRSSGCPICVVDIPLLFETGANLDVDVALVVTAAASVQKHRVMARPGMTEDRFNAIVSRQMPDSDKRRKAHFVIDTSWGLNAARSQVACLLRALSR